MKKNIIFIIKKQINPKNSNETKRENHLKLFVQKKIRFRIQKNSKRRKKSITYKFPTKGRWSYAEQIKFIKALSIYGPNWIKVQEVINFRTLTQIRSHAQKMFGRLKQCKDNKLGIDFTKHSIKSYKDMINHIKSVDSNYNINNILLYLYKNKHKSDDDFKTDYFLKKEKINMSNLNSQMFNKNNNNFDLGNFNNYNNTNNYLNSFILNNLIKEIMVHNSIIGLFFNNLEDINRVHSNLVQSSNINNLNSFNKNYL